MFFGTILINQMYILFVFSLLEKTKQKLKFLTLYSLINVFFLILLIKPSNYYKDFAPRFGFGFWPIPQLWLHIYMIFWFWSCLYGFIWLLKGIKTSENIKRQQIKIVAVACSIGFLGGSSNWPMWYSIYSPPYPSITISIYVGLIAYGILRHRLMDFNLIVRWGLAFGISVFVLLTIFSTIFFLVGKILLKLFSVNLGITTITVACLSVISFDPLRRKISFFVDRFIFKSPDFQSLLQGIETELIKQNDIESISLGLSSQFKNIWQVTHAGFALWDPTTAQFQLHPKNAFDNNWLLKTGEPIVQSDFLVRTLELEKRLFKHRIVVEEEVVALINLALPGEKATFIRIKNTMQGLGANACVPLLWGDRLVGFIVLGPKKSGAIYNDEDKKFLSHVAEIVTEAMKRILTNNHFETPSQTFKTNPAF